MMMLKRKEASHMKHVGKIVGGFFAVAAVTMIGLASPAQARDSSGSRAENRWDRDRDHDRGRYDHGRRDHRHWNHRHDSRYGRSQYRPYRYYAPPPRWAWYAPPLTYYYGY